MDRWKIVLINGIASSLGSDSVVDAQLPAFRSEHHAVTITVRRAVGGGSMAAIESR